ncbi:MAG: histidine phosphatase family protein [Henriciella sp.]|jgi:probable phosphoglycerate mutase
MQNIFVVTHAQSEHHVERRVGGWYDTGLTKFGVAQAETAASRLRQLISDTNPALVSSDLKRASETASIIGDELGVPVSLDAGLRENSYGEAEGRPQTWLDQRIVAAPYHNRLDHIVVKGAESKRTFVDRIYNSMANLPETTNTIIVTHGYALTFVISYWIGLPLEHAGYVNFSASPAGITHLAQGGFFQNKVVHFISDTSHLPHTSN